MKSTWTTLFPDAKPDSSFPLVTILGDQPTTPTGQCGQESGWMSRVDDTETTAITGKHTEGIQLWNAMSLYGTCTTLSRRRCLGAKP